LGHWAHKGVSSMGPTVRKPLLRGEFAGLPQVSPTDLKISSKKRIFFDRCTAATSSGIAKGAKKEGLQISAESAQKTADLESSFLSVS